MPYARPYALPCSGLEAICKASCKVLFRPHEVVSRSCEAISRPSARPDARLIQARFKPESGSTKVFTVPSKGLNKALIRPYKPALRPYHGLIRP